MLTIVALPLTFLNGVENFSLGLFVVVSNISKILGNSFYAAIKL
jgi:hypothetical protein